MSVIETKPPAGGRAHARLGGRWLALTRAVWIGVTAASLGLFAISVPAGYSLLRTVCADGPCGPEQLRPEAVRSLRELGVSLEAHAAYQTALVVVGTLQPAHVSLWLREPVGGTQEGTSHDGGATRDQGPEAGPRTGGGGP